MDTYVFIRDVVDRLYAGQPNTADAIIATHLASLTASYRVVNALPAGVNYTDPLARLAYVFKYAAAHSYYLAQILLEVRQQLAHPLFSGPNVFAACLGGGPGTDIIGIKKHLLDGAYPAGTILNGCVFDRQPGWNNEWAYVANALGNTVRPYFQPFDATVPLAPNARGYLASADIVTISYLVSEIMHLDAHGAVTVFFKSCFDAVKPGALFVFVDYFGGPTTFFDSLCIGSGLQLVLSSGNELKNMYSFGATVGILDFYTSKFNGHSYKKRTTLGYRILRKM